RPKGSKNQNRRDVDLSLYLRFVQETLKRLLQLVGEYMQVVYFIFDGAFGHNEALQMIRQLGLHLISKLRHDAALYFPYEGPYSGRGKGKKYGKKLNYRDMPDAVVLENSNMAQLASKEYLSVHSQPKEDRHDSDDASSGKVYDIFMPQSRLSAVQSLQRRHDRSSFLDGQTPAHRTAALHRVCSRVLGARRDVDGPQQAGRR